MLGQSEELLLCGMAHVWRMLCVDSDLNVWFGGGITPTLDNIRVPGRLDLRIFPRGPLSKGMLVMRLDSASQPEDSVLWSRVIYIVPKARESRP